MGAVHQIKISTAANPPTIAVRCRSCGQLQSIFQDCERVMKKFRAETDIGPIEIEAFLLSIWITVREAKETYPEFAWKKLFPTLYNIVPPDLDRRAEIETFIPSLPDSRFKLPRILASLRYASSGDEVPPPTKKARHCSPSVAETPPPQASSSRRQLTPPVVEHPKPKPIGRGAAVEIAPTGNIHVVDQATDIDAYVRCTHNMGYISDHFDEVAEIYPNVVDKPAGGILAPPVAVEKVSSVVHDSTIVPEGHVTFYICSNCATRGQRCISRGLGKRCFSCNKGKMSCSLHPSILQLLIAQERLRPLNNVGSISIVNMLQRVIVARRNADLHHFLLRNSMLDYDDVLAEACILLEQQRQVLKLDDLASCFENPQDLQTLFTLFACLGIDYGSAMSNLRDQNPPPEVFSLSKDGDVVPEDAAEPETHFYVRGPTQQTVFGEFDRLPPESCQVEERVPKFPAGYDVNAVGPPPAAVSEMRRQSKGKGPSRPFVTPPAAQSSPQRTPLSSDPRVRPTSPVYHQSPVGRDGSSTLPLSLRGRSSSVVRGSNHGDHDRVDLADRKRTQTQTRDADADADTNTGKTQKQADRGRSEWSDGRGVDAYSNHHNGVGGGAITDAERRSQAQRSSVDGRKDDDTQDNTLLL
ncbi:hypothetical protein DFH06DRAFT_1150860 [Mycena polygramma]|nr:hypothetical protein DFH06DRAFT_1150860 [Mycena polygramma]